MGIDLSVIWFVIIVFATLMYIVMDGFDLGIGILFPAIQDADDRDVMVNSVAPVWDGNETWLVLGGAALFGLGWGLVGLCPGPALAALTTGAWQAFVFVGALAAGMALFRLTLDRNA